MRVLRALAVVLILVWSLFPVYWVFVTSFKRSEEVITRPPTWVPRHPVLDNYVDLFTKVGFHVYLANSLVVSLGATLLSIAVGGVASYALARLKVSPLLSRLFLLWTLVVRMFPPIVLVIPVFVLFRDLGLVNTRAGLILAYQIYTLPYVIWLLLGFFREIPAELEEAALVDGAGRLRVFVEISLPLVAPGLVATSILSMLQAWNEFLYALIFVYSQEKKTITLAIAGFITEFEIQWGLLAAGGLVSSLPILALSVYIQRFLMRGLGLGRGVKA